MVWSVITNITTTTTTTYTNTCTHNCIWNSVSICNAGAQTKTYTDTNTDKTNTDTDAETLQELRTFSVSFWSKPVFSRIFLSEFPVLTSFVAADGSLTLENNGRFLAGDVIEKNLY